MLESIFIKLRSKDTSQSVSDQTVHKVFIVAIKHIDFTKLAVLRLANGSIKHVVYNGYDWLLVPSDTLKESSSGNLRSVDVDQITFVLNLDTFLDDVTMSKATWRECKGELMIVLDEERI